MAITNLSVLALAYSGHRDPTAVNFCDPTSLAGSRNLVTDPILIQLATEWGFALTARQLERWRNDGLLPPLARRGRGRGMGQERFYEADPSEQLRKLLSLREMGLPMAEIAIRLWLAGYPVDLDHVRRHLPRALKSVYRFRQHLKSPKFAERYAEYLTRTPRARESWFGDRHWDNARYDSVVEAVDTMAEPENATADARSSWRFLAERLVHLNEEERALVVALDGDPSALLDSILLISKTIFDRLEGVSDEDIISARDVQKSMMALIEVSNRIAMLMPNPLSSMLGRVVQNEDWDSSYGLFMGFSTLVLAGEDPVIPKIQSLHEQLTQVWNNLSSR